MKMFRFLALIFLFSYAHAQLSQSEIQEIEIEQCRRFDGDACDAVISKLNISNPRLAGELSQISCINHGRQCHNAFSNISVPEQKKLVQVMDKACAQTAGRICRELADIYVDLKDYKKAISAAKKQFAKSKDGIYPLYEYKYGSREKGIKAARINCATEQDSCGFYLVNLKPNKSTPFLLERATAVCENETQFSYGSDTCVLTALYLYRQGLHERAIDVLMHSCKRENLRACIYILGLPPAPGPLQAKALRLYCRTDADSPKVKTEPGMKMLAETYLNCTGVTPDTMNISRENILLSWDELKLLDKAFRDPI